jgi:hypothetical protein
MINMRFEHSQVSPNAIAPPSKQVSPVAIGKHEKVLPLHLICLGLAAVMLAVFDFAGHFGYMKSQWAFYMSFFALTPVVIVTSAIVTLLRGDITAWWRYEET